MHGGWITTNELADSVKIAWITAEKHLKQLYKLKYVMKGKSKKGRVYWRANI